MPNPNTAAFPTSVANIPLATDNYSSTLSSGIGAADTYIPVASLPTNASPTVITIDNEVIFAANNNATGFTNCVRGVDGTLGANHSSGNNVYGYVAAYYLNQLAAEVTALESAWFSPAADCCVLFASNQTLTNANGSYVLFQLAETGRNTPSSMFTGNFSVPSNKIVVPSNGLYAVHAQVTFDYNTTGYRILELYVNGGVPSISPTQVSGPSIGTGNNTLYTNTVGLHGVIGCNANDALSLIATQTSGGNLNMVSQLPPGQFFSVTKIF